MNFRKRVLGTGVISILALTLACGGGSSAEGDNAGASSPPKSAMPDATMIIGEFTQGSPNGKQEPGVMKGAPGAIFGSLDGLAEFLGISRQQLEADMQLPGATQAGVAALYGKSREELKAFLIAANEKSLAEAVASGRIEQAAADQLKAAFARNLDAMIDAPAGGAAGPVTTRPGG